MFVFFVLFVSVRLFVPFFFFFFFKENDIHKGLYRNTVSFELMQLAISMFFSSTRFSSDFSCEDLLISSLHRSANI